MTTATMTTAEKTAPKIVVIDRNRDVVTGRFAPKAAKWGVTTVRLGNGRVGYRNGVDGIIFANRESAVSRALAVRPSIVHVGAIKRMVGPIAPKPAAPVKAARPARTFGEGIERIYQTLEEHAAMDLIAVRRAIRDRVIYSVRLTPEQKRAREYAANLGGW